MTLVVKAEIVPQGKRVNVRHLTKYARTKSRAAVMLGNVTMGSIAIGNLTGEYDEDMTWDNIEIPEAIKSKFRVARYSSEGFTDAKTKEPLSKAQALVAFGDSFYYLP